MEMYSNYINFMHNLDGVNVLSTERSRAQKVYKKRFDPMKLKESLFRQKYRFSKANMKKIIDLVRPDLEGSKRGGNIPVDLQVMAAIRYWGRNEMQDDGADIHGFSQPTLSVICNKVARALASKSALFIKMPTQTSEQIMEINGFMRIRGFPGVIGAIDCTHIKIPKVGGPVGQYYINRKGFYSLNTQVVCDSALKIRDIVCRWRGSTHDSRIFRESRIKERFDRGEFKGRLLGDGGYACSNILFTPLLNPRTHAEEQYNIAHIATRNTVERCFGVWKSRFRILLTGFRCSLEHTKTAIIALAVLHNLAIKFKDTASGIDEYEDENIRAEQNIHSEIEALDDERNLTRSVFIQQHFN